MTFEVDVFAEPFNPFVHLPGVSKQLELPMIVIEGLLPEQPQTPVPVVPPEPKQKTVCDAIIEEIRALDPSKLSAAITHSASFGADFIKYSHPSLEYTIITRTNDDDEDERYPYVSISLFNDTKNVLSCAECQLIYDELKRTERRKYEIYAQQLRNNDIEKAKGRFPGCVVSVKN